MKPLKIFMLLFGILILSSLCFATENGGGAYPNGAEDFMSGAVPPPGFYYINYTVGYFSDVFADSKGKIPCPISN